MEFKSAKYQKQPPITPTADAFAIKKTNREGNKWLKNDSPYSIHASILSGRLTRCAIAHISHASFLSLSWTTLRVIAAKFAKSPSYPGSTKRNCPMRKLCMMLQGNILTWDLGIWRQGDVEFRHGQFKRFHTNSESLPCVYVTLLYSGFWSCGFVFALKLLYLRPYQPVVLSEHNYEGDYLVVIIMYVAWTIIARNVLPFSLASCTNLSSPASNTRPPAVGVSVQSLDR